MSIAQSPETAKFDGMPRSAIAAGMADHVAAPAEMPAIFLAYARHDYASAPAAIEASCPMARQTSTKLSSYCAFAADMIFAATSTTRSGGASIAS